MTQFADLADSSQFDAISRYARDCATDLINESMTQSSDSFRIAQNISADAIESASFSNLPIDPELLYALISIIICDRLNCDESDISADF
jgi:hypothetical protein